MTPNNPGAPTPFLVVTPSDWAEHLRGKVAAVNRLTNGLRVVLSSLSATGNGVEDVCSAIDELLGADLRAQLYEIEHPTYQNIPAVTTEMLVAASERVAAFQNQLDTTRAFLKDVPKPQADFIEANMVPTIMVQLGAAEQYRDMLQRQLENREV